VPCHHSAVISKTADAAQYNSAVISKNADVTGLHSAAVSKAADVACCHLAVISKTPASPVTARWLFLKNTNVARYHSAVISKTPTSPAITRSLFLKRRRGSKGLGCYLQNTDVATKKGGGRTTRLPPLKILTINQTFFLYKYAGKSKNATRRF
jgi:hypothetical protein